MSSPFLGKSSLLCDGCGEKVTVTSWTLDTAIGQATTHPNPRCAAAAEWKLIDGRAAAATPTNGENDARR